jgi:hypothetical protein
MTIKAAPWTIERHHPSVFTLSFAQQCRVLEISDAHWDNKHCDRAALKRDLEEAKATGAPVIMIGDFFCAMQGKWDKRADDKQLRPEHRGSRYLDNLVNTAAKWLAPYAAQIALITYGNHETSILGHHQTDLLQRLHQELSHCPGYVGHIGSYAGFLKIRATLKGTSSNTKVIAWNHGYGGGGEVTRGMIDHSRTRSQAHADIYIGGHIHRRNADENIILELEERHNTVRRRSQWFLRSSTYKQETGAVENDISGWHVERGRGERPVGGWWLEFEAERSGTGRRATDLKFRPVPTWA